MGGLSDVYENWILDALLGETAFPRDTTVYVGLFTTLPDDSGGGVEPTGGGYERVAVPNDATNWPAASGSQKANGVAVEFPVSTAAWGTVVGFGIFDYQYPIDGLIIYGYLMTPLVVNANVVSSFPIGTLVVTAD